MCTCLVYGDKHRFPEGYGEDHGGRSENSSLRLLWWGRPYAASAVTLGAEGPGRVSGCQTQLHAFLYQGALLHCKPTTCFCLYTLKMKGPSYYKIKVFYSHGYMHLTMHFCNEYICNILFQIALYSCSFCKLFKKYSVIMNVGNSHGDSLIRSLLWWLFVWGILTPCVWGQIIVLYCIRAVLFRPHHLGSCSFLFSMPLWMKAAKTSPSRQDGAQNALIMSWSFVLRLMANWNVLNSTTWISSS